MDIVESLANSVSRIPPITPYEPQQFVFVVGAPRSGTTLLTQVLGQRLGYITNIAARFPTRPDVGIALSRHILPDAKPSYASDYARTDRAGDINEFGWFWMDAFAIDDPHEFAEIDAPLLGINQLLTLQKCFDKPIVMKGIYPAYYPNYIANITKHPPIWLHIKRNPVDACVSIYEARKRTGKAWFGWWPRGEIPEGEIEQVAYQVWWFRNYYDSFATHTIDLVDLCISQRYAFEVIGMSDVRIDNQLLKLRRYESHPLYADFEREMEKYQ